jgi:uncharacterized protein (TIGR03437 family)
VTGDTYSNPFPLREAAFGPPPPNVTKPFAAHLDASGSTLLFSSYLGFHAATKIATDGGGSIYIAANTPVADSSDQPAALLAKFSAAPPAGPAPRRVVDAFRRANAPLSPQEIVIVDFPEFAPASEIDLGLQPKGGAPLQLGGVSVEFNGVRAPVLAVRGGEIECVTPAALGGQSFAAVQVVNGGVRSGVLNVDVAENSLALYQARNQDGSVNSPRNPAPPGSQVTFLFTGNGLSSPAPADGAIAGNAPRTSPPVKLWLIPPQQSLIELTPDVSPAPGYVTGLFAASATVPQATGVVTVQLFPQFPAALPYPFIDTVIPLSVGTPTPLRHPRRPRNTAGPPVPRK